MADFFTLDRVISRQEHILYDAMSIQGGVELTVKTNSKAQKQRIKFFLDAVEYIDGTTNVRRQVGNYFELEDGQCVNIITVHNTMTVNHNQGTYSFPYPDDSFIFYFNCSNSNDGSYNIQFTNGTNNFTLWISSVSICDSYYNTANGWLNPDNPNNIIGTFTSRNNTTVNTSYIPPSTPAIANLDVTLQDTSQAEEVNKNGGLLSSIFRRKKSNKQE